MRALPLLVTLALVGCDRPAADPPSGEVRTAAVAEPADCDADDGGLTLPDGFCAVVVGEVGAARHLAVRENGDVFVKLREGGVVALRDTTGDGRADVEARFGDFGGTGVALRGGYLYASSNDAVYRWLLPAGALAPTGDPEPVVTGFPQQRQHAAKPFDFAGDDLFVTVGAPANACQREGRTPGSPGQDPCPLLETTAGVWRFAADETGQRYRPGAPYATGVRHAIALATDPGGALWVVQHGRDQLDTLWPDRFTAEENARLPAEEMLRLEEGADAGWPYCYFDPELGRKVLAPEYGGDGEAVGRCTDFEMPAVAFPAHWAPNDLLFYTGDQFPARYRGGAFVAFHGSWNRAPLPQAGYNVAFVPMTDGAPTGDFEVFADGFAGAEPLASPGDARFRPMGLAEGPDGALYVVDSVEGRVWRITYTG